MKSFTWFNISCFCILILLSTNASADNWTTEQKILEGAYVVAVVADYKQTIQIAELSDESNPYLGLSPNPSKIKSYFIKMTALHWIMADLMPSKWRTRFLYATTGFQVSFVVHNYWLGYTVKF